MSLTQFAMTRMENKPTRIYDVALSFASEDREYVEAVAASLRQAGVSVFYDHYEEAVLWGKNLYDHLRLIYTESAEYTVMFISEAYARKLWTNHERESAQARAFAERSEYILPARFDDTEVPGLLRTTGYVDLRQKKPNELASLIVEKLALRDQATSATGSASLRSNPLFAAAIDELNSQNRPSNAILTAILEEASAPDGLAEFLLLLVKQSKEYDRLILGGFAVSCIDKFDIGYEAVDYCLGDGALNSNQRESLGMHLQWVTRCDVIRWAHKRLIRDIRSDTYYNSFLQKHYEFIFEHLAGEMTGYLLVPNRGPVEYNIDSLMLVAERYSKPTPFVGRIREWIFNGNFDGKTRENAGDDSAIAKTTMGAGILYVCLNEIAQMRHDHPLQSLRSWTCDRTIAMLSSSKNLNTGLYHLYIMRAQGFVDLERMLSRVRDCPSTDEDTQRLFLQLKYGYGFDQLGESQDLATRLGLF